MGNNSNKITKYIAMLVLAVLVFNGGVYLGRALGGNSLFQPAQNNEPIPRDEDEVLPSDPNTGLPGSDVMDDESFVTLLSQSLEGDARIEAHPEYEGVFVIPTSDAFIDAINSAFSDGDDYQQWQSLVGTFLEISTYTRMNIYLINPYNEELMLLWVHQNEIYYNFVTDGNQTDNHDPAQSLSISVGRSLI